LDVFEKEPIELDDGLLKLEKMVMLPHLGSATVQTRSAMVELAAANVVDVLGRRPKAVVNPVVLNRFEKST
jgi:lactate dehydrogenase-like 2-hydroxyacid dehydrogenase